MQRTKNQSVVFTRDEFNEAVVYYANREKIYQLVALITLVLGFFIGCLTN